MFEPLVLLFLASGATSLVYETLWMRQLHQVVGTDHLAVTTTLAAFMAGLAIGGFGAGRWADRVRRPLLAYAGLEVFIGLWAIAFPLLLAGAEPLLLSFWRSTEPGPVAGSLVQFFVLGALLLPPTACMGATLPLLVRVARGAPGVRIGALYGANTLGAVVGTAAAGFVLMPEIGVRGTMWVTVAGNLAVGAAATILDRYGDPAPEPAEAPAPVARGLMVLAALAGGAALLCEVAWFRLLVLLLGGSVYAFSTMLVAFLLGIGLGGWAGGGLADRAARDGPAGPLRWLVGLQVATALLTWGGMYGYGELPFAYIAMWDALKESREVFWPSLVGLSLVVVLPPTLCMGAAFPMLVRVAADDALALGRPVGRLYGANTLGAIAGAAAGGLLFLPWLHVTGTLLLASAIYLLGALLAAGRAGLGPVGLGVSGLTAAGALGMAAWWPPPWRPMIMTAGLYKYASEFDDHTRAGVLNYTVTPYDMLFYDEGPACVVTVARSKRSGNIWMANNGKVDASTSTDMPTQLLVSHLPFAFKPDARSVLVVGVASGITLGAAARHAEPERIEAVEIEPAVVRASRLFDAYSGAPLDDRRVKLFVGDGRNHLVRARPGSYDLVVCEPANPWQSGVSNLFTREFWEMGRTRLAPGGVWSQWVQVYGMGKEDLRSLVGTFASVYDHVLMFNTIEDADLVLVGSDSPLDLRSPTIDALFRPGLVKDDLARVQVTSREDVLARFVMDRAEILALSEGSTPNTDDNMRIEFSAPRHLYLETRDQNHALLRPHWQVPYSAVDGDDGRLRLARAYGRREDFVRALLVLKDLDLPEADALYVEYQEILEKKIAEVEAEEAAGARRRERD